MPKTERLREVLSVAPTPEYLNQMGASGWRLVALEWQRETDEETAVPENPPRLEDAPYGLQVADDGRHLMESAGEMRVLVAAVKMIVDDLPVSRVAEELNRYGYRTRSGERWSAAAVFDLLPRMIEAGPKIFAKDEWAGLRTRLPS
jgi:hypothetical protein